MRELRENILPYYDEYVKRLKYKFYIMTENVIGIVFAKHLYRVRIIEIKRVAYWDLWFRGNSIFVTHLGKKENFYDVLCAITENEKSLIEYKKSL